MLVEEEIREVVEIQRRTYRLLLWMNTAMEKGFVSFSRAHSYSSDAEAAVDWIDEHFENLPADARPSDRSEASLRRFANMFISYLTASFDLVEEPGRRLKSDCGCFCPMCRYLIHNPHLRVRSVTRNDSGRAKKLKTEFINTIAEESQVALSDEKLDELLQDAEFKEALALATYGAQLPRRAAGNSEKGALLALWREFAWTKDGSPKRGFELDAERVIDAEKRVRARVNAYKV
jgi:hypothetical protein